MVSGRRRLSISDTRPLGAPRSARDIYRSGNRSQVRANRGVRVVKVLNRVRAMGASGAGIRGRG
jgi:hypothetical protein